MESADLTLVSMNMMLTRYADRIDRDLHVPLGPLYLTGAIARAGFAVDFRDIQSLEVDDPFDLDTFLRFAQSPAPVVGFSCLSNLLPFTLLAMRALKTAYPDRVLVLGGSGAKGVEGEILARFPWVEVIVRGEAELSAPLLMERLERGGSLDEVPGISFRDGGTIRHTGSPPRLVELDTLGWPAYHHFDMTRLQGFDLIGSRGCQFACSFCASTAIWNHQACYRSPAGIVAEMRALHERHGAKLFLFQDDLFTSSRERMLEFCAELEGTGLQVAWKALGRVDLVDEEVLRAMARAGCVDIRFGIESGSDELRRSVGKHLAQDRTADIVRLATDLYPEVHLFFVWGLPGETTRDFHQSLFQMIAYQMMGATIVPSLFAFTPAMALFAQVDPSKLEFDPELFGDQMITGHALFADGRFHILPQHDYIFAFIREHPGIFPGFFHLDRASLRPKLEALKEFGFYPS